MFGYFKSFDSLLTREVTPLPFVYDQMNKTYFVGICLSGVFIAVLVVLLSDYFVWKSEVFVPQHTHKPFTPLPDEELFRPTDEGTIAVIIKKRNVADEEKTAHVQASEKEALSSLHAALEMKNEGKNDKAFKLFQHAAALAPKHSDILNHYGEFVEKTQQNIVLADQMYFQALTYSPGHSKAASNRQRTASVVKEIDNSMFQRIDAKRDRISAIPDTNTALRRAKKEAYFQHIYHTVGIEGNTMTLSQTRSIVETQMAIGGKSILEHNEILGLNAAMKYINATLVNRFGPITLKDILEIHRRVMGFVDPFSSGEFRRTQVYVGGHMPPSPRDISPLMHEFERWLNSEVAARMHPLEYAALAHYKLVHIHPFEDGNGRTSRLLMNAILMQAGFPPVIIPKQDRHKYYEVLELANEGDVRPFIRFIADCTEKTLDLYLWATLEYSQIPELEDDSKIIVLEDVDNSSELKAASADNVVLFTHGDAQY